MDPQVASPSAGPAAEPAPAAAPAVAVLMVAHDPGPWFEETLASVGAQDYPSLDVVVVDAASSEPVEARVHAVLTGARVVRLPENRGFGRALNAAIGELTDQPFLLLAHDDVAADPAAVRALVEEAFRSNAGIVGPKLVPWDEPEKLLSVGEGADKFGFPVAHVERGELDQEQHDAVRDVFTVPDAFTLVRRDLFDALGGFDEETSYFCDDLDLCWRAHVAGARVMVNPAARVRHLEALAARRPVDDRRRLQFRHRMRVMLTAYRPLRTAAVLPQLAVIHLVELVFSLLTGRFGQVRDIATAWTWNLARLGSLRDRRRALHEVRRVPDNEVRNLMVRGSARISAFMRGQLASSQEALGSAATFGRRVYDAVAGPQRREALAAWSVLLMVLVFGSRHLLTRPIPAIGEFVPFPETISPLLGEWFGSWRRAGLGSEGFAATGELLVAGGSAALLGASGLLRTVLILGMLPLGMLGVWRLVAPAHSLRCSIAALVAYAAVPLGYDSLATGSWRGLVAYGVTPWIFARVARAGGTAPFAGASTATGGRGGAAPLWRQTLALGIVSALAAAVEPLMVLMPLAIVVGMLPVSILVVKLGGMVRMFAVSLGSTLIAVLLHLPWVIELVGSSPDWSTFAGRRGLGGGGDGLSHLLRFDTGPMGSSSLNAAVCVAAAYAVLVGRGWRLEWAARAWSTALACWLLAWSCAMGWLPFELPPDEVLLAPAAAALALAVGLGVAAFELDVRRSRFGWRQLTSIVAVVALGLAFLPVVSAAVGGRWLMPRGSHAETLAFLDAEAAQEPTRVLWLGDPEVLPMGSWPMTEGLSYATTLNGTARLPDLWPGPAEDEEAPLRGALDLALGQETSRLGRLLAPMGVRYIVLLDQGAPAPFGGVRSAVADPVVDAFAAQLDLEQVDVNPAMRVYRNGAWSPYLALVPDGSIEASAGEPIPDGARLAATTELAGETAGLARRGVTTFTGRPDQAAQLLLGAAPAGGWNVRIDGTGAGGETAFGWAGLYDVPAGAEVEVSWTTSLTHRALMLGQLALLAAAAAVMWRTRAERRRQRS